MEKDAVMIFEQPAELNRYLYPPPENGAPSSFWLAVKIISPGFLFIGLLMLEVRCLKGLPFLPGLAIAVLLLVVPLALLQYGIRKEDQSKRTLSIHDDGLSFSHARARRIRWKRIQCFRVEPCGPQGEFKMFTARYSDPGVMRSRPWSMIFADAASCAALLAALEKRRIGKDRKWVIEILRAPAIIPRKEIPVALIWLSWLSFAFLCNGLHMLLAGTTWPKEPPRAKLERLSPRIRALVIWFAGSGVDPSRFFTVTGAVLTAIGGAGIWIPMMLDCRQEKIQEAAEAEDIKGKLVTADA
jgi:hypothetical protein